MAKFVKWGHKFREAIKLKMVRGATPELLKASFAKLVDELQTPDMKLKEAEAEIRRLQRQLKRNQGP